MLRIEKIVFLWMNLVCLCEMVMLLRKMSLLGWWLIVVRLLLSRKCDLVFGLWFMRSRVVFVWSEVMVLVLIGVVMFLAVVGFLILVGWIDDRCIVSLVRC